MKGGIRGRTHFLFTEVFSIPEIRCLHILGIKYLLSELMKN